MPASLQFLLDFLQLRPQPLLDRDALQQEPSVPSLPATMRESQKIEGRRSTEPSLLPAPGGEPSELDQPRLLGRQLQLELREPVTELRQNPYVWFLVAVRDGAVIGHVALSLSTREGSWPAAGRSVFVWQLFVRPAWHGHGIGTMLKRAAVSEALSRSFSLTRLWTPEGARRARRFYEREGWALTGGAHRHSDFGLATVEYGRRIP